MSQFTGSTFNSYTGRWLIIVGIFELALAGVFVVMGMSIPFVGDGMLLTAASLGITGIGLLLFGLRARRSAAAADLLARTGIAGQATITGLTQTGMYLNEQPQVAMDLLVQLPGRAPYVAQRREFVPLILLGRLTSGLPLPVKVDSADPQRLIIDWPSAGAAMPLGVPGTAQMPGMATAAPGATPQPLPAFPDAPLAGASSVPSAIDESLGQVQAALAGSGAPVAAAFSDPSQGGYTVEQLRAHLRQNGVQATARIDQVMDMGQVIGDERLYTIQATLELPGEQPKQLAPSAAMVPLTAVPKVRVGWRIPVRVAAENHQLMMFEWEKV